MRLDTPFVVSASSDMPQREGGNGRESCGRSLGGQVVGKEGGTNPLERLRVFAHSLISLVKYVPRTAFRTFPSIDAQDCPALHRTRSSQSKSSSGNSKKLDRRQSASSWIEVGDSEYNSGDR